MRGFLLTVVISVCSVVLSAQERQLLISDISIIGNEKTKPQTILREFRYSVGDSILEKDIDKEIVNFTDNLRRLMLFNNVDISYSLTECSCSINVNVVERWYYWVYPILEIADRNITSYFYYKDFGKINYGVAFDWLNFRGCNEMLNFKLRLGYKEHYAISYQKPNIGRKKRSGVWIRAEYFRQKKEIASVIDCKPVYAENENKYIRKMFDVGVGYVFRPQVNYEFSMSLIYQNVCSNDSLLLIGASKLQNFMVPTFTFEYDDRDSKVSPVSGIYAWIGIKLFSDFSSCGRLLCVHWVVQE